MIGFQLGSGLYLWNSRGSGVLHLISKHRTTHLNRLGFMEKVAYSPFVLISLVIHGLAAIAITLAPNTFSSNGNEAISGLFPVRVRLLALPPVLDQKATTTPPVDPSLQNSDNFHPPIAEFSLQTGGTFHSPMSGEGMPDRQGSNSGKFRLKNPSLVEQKKPESKQFSEFQVEVKDNRSENLENLGHQSIPLAEVQNRNPQPSQPTLETPDVFKAVTVVSLSNQKLLSTARTATSPASRLKIVSNLVRSSRPVARQTPTPSIQRSTAAIPKKTTPNKSKALVLLKHRSRKKLRASAGNVNRVNETIKGKPFSSGLNPDKNFLSSKSDNKLILSKVDNYIRMSSEKSKHLKKPKTATELLSSLKDPILTGNFIEKTKKQKIKRKARLAPLMTQDIRYRGYRYAIWKKIDGLLFYPSVAANARVSGKVVVRFEVTRDGQLATLKLLYSSGFELLDEEALMAVRNAAPFPKFPPTINGNRIAIKSEIFYEP